MKKYIIWTPSLSLDSGGVTVLHRLAHMINRLGYKAYLWPGDNNFDTFLSNVKYTISLATKEMVDNEAIVVYPEIVIGNPLNAKNVVRWILNKPGVLGGDGAFGENDIIFYYSDAFTNGQKKFNHLQLIELYGEMFQNRKEERKGSCYLMRKGKDRKIVHDMTDSTEITNVTPSEDLVRIFNEKKIFYCYDYATFLSLQAALCGCISIVVPFDGISGKEWKGMSETRKYGIAYGDEDIEHAISTMDKVRPHLEKLNEKFYNKVQKFIEITQDWAKREEQSNMTSLVEETDISHLSIQSENKILESEIIEAEHLLEKNQQKEAKIILRNIIQQEESNIKVLNYLSMIEISDKNYANAKKTIEKILQIDDTNDIAIDNKEYLTEIFQRT